MWDPKLGGPGQLTTSLKDEMAVLLNTDHFSRKTPVSREYIAKTLNILTKLSYTLQQELKKKLSNNKSKYSLYK